MASSGYILNVTTLKTVGIRELKNNLSAYLQEVRRGTRILVSDRNTIVAELHEPHSIYGLPETENPLLAEWVKKGIVVPATRKPASLTRSPVTLAPGAARKLLDADREERRK